MNNEDKQESSKSPENRKNSVNVLTQMFESKERKSVTKRPSEVIKLERKSSTLNEVKNIIHEIKEERLPVESIESNTIEEDIDEEINTRGKRTSIYDRVNIFNKGASKVPLPESKEEAKLAPLLNYVKVLDETTGKMKWVGGSKADNDNDPKINEEIFAKTEIEKNVDVENELVVPLIFNADNIKSNILNDEMEEKFNEKIDLPENTEKVEEEKVEEEKVEEEKVEEEKVEEVKVEEVKFEEEKVGEEKVGEEKEVTQLTETINEVKEINSEELTIEKNTTYIPPKIDNKTREEIELKSQHEEAHKLELPPTRVDEIKTQHEEQKIIESHTKIENLLNTSTPKEENILEIPPKEDDNKLVTKFQEANKVEIPSEAEIKHNIIDDKFENKSFNCVNKLDEHFERTASPSKLSSSGIHQNKNKNNIPKYRDTSPIAKDTFMSNNISLEIAHNEERMPKKIHSKNHILENNDINLDKKLPLLNSNNNDENCKGNTGKMGNEGFFRRYKVPLLISFLLLLAVILSFILIFKV